MARLIIRSAGFENRSIELKLGANRIGRGSENDFQIAHPTVSVNHCEIILSDAVILIRDKNSTNGTFLNGQRIREGRLLADQTLRLGDVEFFVENIDVSVAIPKFDTHFDVAPPVVLADGSMVCRRHSRATVTHKCTFCNEVMCDACVKILKRQGSAKFLKLCPICSHRCEPIGGPKPKKKSFFGFFPKTIKLPLFGRNTDSES
jgi:hypothetical protein